MRGNVQGFTSLVVNGGETMPGLITMDDLTNDEILQILDDAERLLASSKWRDLFATITRKNSWQSVL